MVKVFFRYSVKLAIGAVVFVIVCLPASAENLCAGDAKNIDARLEITRNGISKLVQAVTNSQLPAIAKNFAGMRFDDFSFGPERKKCTKEKIHALAPADAWDQCYGMPAVLGARGAKFDMLLKPEPADFKVSNFVLKNIEFGEMKEIPCSKEKQNFTSVKEICYELPVQNLSIAGSLDVRSQYSNEVLFRMDRWITNVDSIKDSAGNALIPHVKLKALINANGTLQKILQINEGFTSSILPPGSLSLGMNLSQEEFADLAEKIFAGIYDDFQPTLHLPKLSTNLEKMQYWEAHPEIIKANANRFHSQYGKQLMIHMGSNFDSEQSLVLFLAGKNILERANQLLQSDKKNGPEIDSLMQLPMEKISELLTRNAMPAVSKAINQYMQSLPFLHNEYTHVLPALHLQDAIDAAQFAQATKERVDLAHTIAREIKNSYNAQDLRDSVANWRGYQSSLQDFRKSFARARDPSSKHFLLAVAKAWEKNLDVLRIRGQELIAGGTITSKEFNRIFEQEKEKFSIVQKNLLETARDIQERWDSDLDPIFLRTVASQISTTNEEIHLAMRMCTLCSGFDSSGVDINTMPRFKVKKDYDIAAQVSFEFLNNYLKIQHARKVFDLCLHSDPVDTCANATWLSINKYAELQDAPKIARDTSGIYIEGSKLKYGASIFRFNTEAKAYVDVSVCNNGALCLQLKDIKTADGRIEEMLSVEELNKMLGSSGVFLPFDVKAKYVDASSDSITVYGDIREADFPQFFLENSAIK